MMRTAPVFTALAALLSTGIAVAELASDPKLARSPISRDFAEATVADISSIDFPHSATWSPDGTSIAFISQRSGTGNIWIFDVASGKTRALAPSETLQRHPRWSPDGRQIQFMADRAGDEMFDVFVADVATGAVRNLTNTSDYSEGLATWSPDGQAIAMYSRHRDAPAGEIAVIGVNDGDVRFLTSNPSPDRTRYGPIWRGDFIYYNDAAFSMADTDIWRVSTRGGKPENLTPRGSGINNTLYDVSSDGSLALISSDEYNGWSNVALLETATGKIKRITDEAAHFIPATFAPNGRSLVYTRDEPMAAQIFEYHLGSSTTRQLTYGLRFHELLDARDPWPRAGARFFSPDGQFLVYYDRTAVTATEIKALRVTDGSTRTIVSNPLEARVQRGLVQPVHVRFNSRDGKYLIPALVWIPPNLKRDGSHPAVVEIHGGPSDQTRPYLLTYIQVLATQGYIVISPNYRGSINYGRAFHAANRMDFGGGDLSDIEAAADWLLATGYVDPKKLAVYGASNGGYLTLLALGKNPNRWAAGVALYPLVDFHTAYASEAPWMRAFDRAFMGDPIKDAALWRDRSPLTHANKIRAPVMMVAGVNDVRSPADQARQMERAIRSNGGLVALTVFGEQGHGAQQTNVYTDENQMVLDFLNEHLRAGTRRTAVGR